MKQTLINKDIRDLIFEKGGQDALCCCQCGKCFGLCPWNELPKVEYFTYRITQAVKLGDIMNSEDKNEIDAEVSEIYKCVGCEACSTKCPHGVKISDILRAARRILVEYGAVPAELKAVSAKLFNVGNPLGEVREKRMAWAEGLDIPMYNPELSYVYFACCIPAYDRRAISVARSTVKILNAAGVSFGIIGESESCCGENIRRVGAERTYAKLAWENMAVFRKSNVKKIITTSPHCMTAFKNDYKELNLNLEPIHTTQIFAELIERKKLVPKKSIKKKVVYHDPCTLGRQSSIYEEPRAVLMSISELELVEIKNYNREYGLCCGGGSGGLWLDRPTELRMANLRVKQAIATGAEILAVACPYCLLMFEDSVKTMNVNLEIKDISEILVEAI